MHFTALITCVLIGLGVALIHAIRNFKAGIMPQFITVIEILLASMGVAIALKCFMLAWTLDRGASPALSDEDRIYFSFGALALGWASVQAIVRKFLR